MCPKSPSRLIFQLESLPASVWKAPKFQITIRSDKKLKCIPRKQGASFKGCSALFGAAVDDDMPLSFQACREIIINMIPIHLVQRQVASNSKDIINLVNDRHFVNCFPCRRSFELALQWNLPGAEFNPVRAVPRFRFDNARERYLSKAEAQRLLAACKGSSNPQLWAIVSLLLYTGARKSELLKAKWEHCLLYTSPSPRDS